MRFLSRAFAPALLLVAAAPLSAQVSQTINVTLFAGDTGTQIATRIEAAWSQGVDFTCSRMVNTLVVQDTSGTCDNPTAKFTINVPGGTLGSNHTFKLSLMCASPLVSSAELDTLGFVVLTPGLNAFSNLGDTITVAYDNSPPAIPAWSGLHAGLAILGFGLIAALARTRRFRADAA